MTPAISAKDTLKEAIARHNAGELAVAETLYRKVLQQEPRNFDATHLLGVIAFQVERVDDAIALFRKAQSIRKDEPALLANFGSALRKAKKFDEAVQVLDRAITLKPQMYEAWYNKILIQNEDKKFVAAEETARRTLEVRPGDPDTLVALGIALMHQGRWDEAVDVLNRAIAASPNISLAYLTMGEICRNRGQVPEAVAAYEAALKVEPRNHMARMHRAQTLLLTGNLKDGWEHVDSRFWYTEQHIQRRPIPPPYWDGEDLKGRKILAWSEQGLGDEIIYASMLPDIIARGAAVLVECSPRMVPIFARSFPEVKVAVWGESDARNLDGVSYQVAFGSLGKYCRPSFESFPVHHGFLKPDADKVAGFKRKYGRGPLVGLSWRSAAARSGEKKSALLMDWERILRMPGVTFVNLQYGDCAAELAAVREKYGVEVIADAAVNPLDDMDTFFAQVAAMDLVLSTSNTTVHTAGSLGVPTWVMLPDRGNGLLWYWFKERAASPWYPSVRLFRATTGGAMQADWYKDALAGLADEFVLWGKRHGVA